MQWLMERLSDGQGTKNDLEPQAMINSLLQAVAAGEVSSELRRMLRRCPQDIKDTVDEIVRQGQ